MTTTPIVQRFAAKEARTAMSLSSLDRTTYWQSVAYEQPEGVSIDKPTTYETATERAQQ